MLLYQSNKYHTHGDKISAVSAAIDILNLSYDQMPDRPKYLEYVSSKDFWTDHKRRQQFLLDFWYSSLSHVGSFYSYPLTNFVWNPSFILMMVSQFLGTYKTILTIVNHYDSISLARTAVVCTLVSRASKLPEQFDNPAKFV